MNLHEQVHHLRADLDVHIAALASIRSRLRGTDLLHPAATQAAIHVRRIATGLMNSAVSLQDAQRLEAALSRAVLNLPPGA